MAGKGSLGRWQAEAVLQDGREPVMARLNGVSMRFASRPSCIKRLLVIEDDQLVAFDNEHTLKHSGYNFAAPVHSGEAAGAGMAADALDWNGCGLGLSGPGGGGEGARVAQDPPT